MEPRIRNAICRISIMRGGKEVSRGTGALIADGLVLTALHVVGDRKPDPPQPYDGECVLTFPGRQARTQLDPNRCDRLADWAVVHCDESPDAEPIPLGELDRSGVAWESFGFPDMNPVDGMVQTGSVENANGTYQKIRAYQLFSKQAAAGDGGPTSGMSGAPLIVDGAVVGLMRSALQQLGQTADGKTVRNTRGGTLYACPVSAPLEELGDLLPLPDSCRGLPGIKRAPLPEEPFRYLHRFEEKDAEVFFGRNREIRALYERVTDDKNAFVSLLYGQSGVGKSSVLDAGLVPRLRWRHEVRYVRRDPERSLTQTLAELLEAVAATGGVRLSAETTLVERWRAAEEACGRPLIVFFDQIEEVFTNLSRKFPNEFPELFDALRRFTGSESVRGRLLLAFRKEWYPEVQKQLERCALDFSKTFLEPLEHESIREVVLGLTQTQRLKERYGLRVDPGLPEMVAAPLLADATSPVAPALQVLLTKMWQQAKAKDAEKPAFSADLYRAMQKDGVLLGDFLDQQLDELRTREKDFVDSGLALDLLAFHTSDLLTSEQRSEEEIRVQYAHVGDAPQRLEQLKETHLLVSGFSVAAEAPRATRLMHDTLAPLVHKRFEESERPGQRCRRLIESRAVDWNDGAEGSTLDARELEAAQEGRLAMRDLTLDEGRMLEASRVAADKAQQKERIIWTVGSAMLVLVVASAITAGVFAVSASRSEENALRQARAATVRSLAATVFGRAQQSVDLASLLGIEAWNHVKDQADAAALKVEAKNAMRYALEVQPGLRAILHHPDPIERVAYSPDGKTLASADVSGRIWLWDLLAGHPPRSDPLQSPHEKTITGIAYSPDGLLLAAGDESGNVLVWKTDSKPPALVTPGPPPIYGKVQDISFSANAKFLAYSRERGDGLFIWDRESGETHEAGSYSTLTGLAFKPNTNVLVVAREIYLGNSVSPVESTRIDVFDLDVDPRPKIESRASSGDSDLGYDVRARFDSMSFLCNGDKLLLRGDPPAMVWVEQEEGGSGWDFFSRSFRIPPTAYYALQTRISTEGSLLCGGDPDKDSPTVLLLDRTDVLRKEDDHRDDTEPYRHTGHSGNVKTVASSPDGATFASGGSDRTVRIWSPSPQSALFQRRAAVLAYGWEPSSDGRLAAKQLEDNSVELRRRGSDTFATAPLEQPVVAVEDGPEGRLVAFLTRAVRSGNQENRLILWNVQQEGVEAEVLIGEGGSKGIIAFSQDGGRVAVATPMHGAWVWNVADGLSEGPPVARQVNAHDLEFSPDGASLAVTTDSGALLVDVKTKAGRAVDLDTQVSGVAFSPDGAILATAGSGGVGEEGRLVRLWDSQTLAPLASRGFLVLPKAIAPPASTGLAFSEKGRLFGARIDREHLQLWDVASWERLGEPLEGGWSREPAFGDDGSTAISRAGEWDLRVESWAEKACRRAGRNLTLAEWEQYLGDPEDYRKTCPDLPGPTDAEE